MKKGIITPYDIDIEIVAPHTTLCTPELIGYEYTCNNQYCHLQILKLTHDYGFVANNDFTHNEECIHCGYHKAIEEHDLIHQSISSGQHVAECTKCKYSFYEEHKIVMMPALPMGKALMTWACEKCGHIFI